MNYDGKGSDVVSDVVGCFRPCTRTLCVCLGGAGREEGEGGREENSKGGRKGGRKERRKGGREERREGPKEVESEKKKREA